MHGLDTLAFVDIPAASYELGWRFDDVFPDDARESVEDFVSWDELRTRMSHPRTVDLAGFAIATTTVPAEDLLADTDDDDDAHLESLPALCDALDRRLGAHGLRLPTEDELEAACGGGMFHWGDDIPDGFPHGSDTSFRRHLATNARGLVLNSDPYRVEIARAAFKLGDGGESICGGYPWPIAWLALSPSFRLVGDAVEELLAEFLEEARLRPVRR